MQNPDARRIEVIRFVNSEILARAVSFAEFCGNRAMFLA
jgi:hypothetical protein